MKHLLTAANALTGLAVLGYGVVRLFQDESLASAAISMFGGAIWLSTYFLLPSVGRAWVDRILTGRPVAEAKADDPAPHAARNGPALFGYGASAAAILIAGMILDAQLAVGLGIWPSVLAAILCLHGVFRWLDGR